MRSLLFILLVTAPALGGPLSDDAPTSFATARDASRFLRDFLGIDNPGGPLALVGRKLAEQLAQGFDARVPDSVGADDLDDELDDVRPEVDGFRAALPRPVDRLPSQRALDELRRAYEGGILARTVRHTLNRLSKDERSTPLPVRVAILRVRSDRTEYRALVDSLSRDILTAASADLVETNQRLGQGSNEAPAADDRETESTVADRAPAAFEPPDTGEPMSLPAWPWLVGAATAVFALSFRQLLRTQRHDSRTQTGSTPRWAPDDDRFDSVTQVRPVRPGIHQSPSDDN